jgi:hypothetical protein
MGCRSKGQQRMLLVLAEAVILHGGSPHLGQTQYLVESAIHQQPGVVGHPLEFPVRMGRFDERPGFSGGWLKSCATQDGFIWETQVNTLLLQSAHKGVVRGAKSWQIGQSCEALGAG